MPVRLHRSRREARQIHVYRSDGKEIGALPELKVPVALREEDYTTAMQAVLCINGCR